MEFMKGEGLIKVSDIDIVRIQDKYGIEMLENLKRFYLEHNGEKIYLCIFGDDRQYEIAKFLPLTGKNSVERVKDNDLIDGFIPRNFIPFARDRGGDYYYWDNDDAKIYLVRGDKLLVVNRI